MSHNGYRIGDTVVLKAGLTRTAAGGRTCSIVGVLPSGESGEAQYRVRFGNESFERRVVQSDIDAAESRSPHGRSDAADTAQGEPWLKPSTIRIGK